MRLFLAGVTFFATAGLATAVAADEWRSVSRSARAVQLADIASIAAEGDATTIRVAVVPRTGADQTHRVNTYAFQCAAGRYRVPLTVEYGADGAEVDGYDDAEAPWEDVVADSVTDFVRAIACDGSRPQAEPHASVAAWIEAGRP